jgi:hypothetical protein
MNLRGLSWRTRGLPDEADPPELDIASDSAGSGHMFFSASLFVERQ